MIPSILSRDSFPHEPCQNDIGVAFSCSKVRWFTDSSSAAGIWAWTRLSRCCQSAMVLGRTGWWFSKAVADWPNLAGFRCYFMFGFGTREVNFGAWHVSMCMALFTTWYLWPLFNILGFDSWRSVLKHFGRRMIVLCKSLGGFCLASRIGCNFKQFVGVYEIQTCGWQLQWDLDVMLWQNKLVLASIYHGTQCTEKSVGYKKRCGTFDHSNLQFHAGQRDNKCMNSLEGPLITKTKHDVTWCSLDLFLDFWAECIEETLNMIATHHSFRGSCI